MTDEEGFFASLPPTRRSFIKKMVAVAFVAPVISSFSLDALASTSPQRTPNQPFPNQRDDDDDDKKEKDKEKKKKKKKDDD
jgi:hypothetical protein